MNPETGGYFNQVVFLVNQARFMTTTIITPELILRYKYILNNKYVHVHTCACCVMLVNIYRILFIIARITIVT